MGSVFLKLFNMSVAASWLILAVIAARFVLKRAPKWITCVMWAVVAARLLLPFSIESSLSAVPSAETLPEAAMSGPSFNIDSGIPVVDEQVNLYLDDHYYEGVSVDSGSGRRRMDALGFVWLAGFAAMLAYAAVSYLRLRRKVAAAVPAGKGLWLCDGIDSPFILGVGKPRIYLPSDMEEENLAHVVAHENAHLARKDHWWKPLGYALLAAYWFNPLCWAAYALLCRDIELACDERVVKTLGAGGRKAYSEALLSCSVPRGAITACPLAFGEVGIKERIKKALSYKKPAFWITAASLAVCTVIAVCFLTNPRRANADTRPTLLMNGASYVDPYMPVRELPDGYVLAGELTDGLAHDTGLAGCKYYVNPADDNSFYVYQECGTPIDDHTIDSTTLQWAYVRWVREGSGGETAPPLTLDDVRRLSEKGDSLTWSDFERYDYIETGSGLYIRVYDVDELFSLWIGGGSTDEKPTYIYLSVDSARHQMGDDYVDIRTGDLEAFIEKHKDDESATADLGGFASPLNSFTISRGVNSYHRGLDLAAETGEPICAAAGGTVVFSGDAENLGAEAAGYGLLVIIDHGDGVRSFYAHNSENLVSAGDYVERGQTIAKTGSTGNSTGSHLHFEVRLDDTPMMLTVADGEGRELIEGDAITAAGNMRIVMGQKLEG